LPVYGDGLMCQKDPDHCVLPTCSARILRIKKRLFLAGLVWFGVVCFLARRTRSSVVL
jgi:hypothetical protein